MGSFADKFKSFFGNRINLSDELFDDLTDLLVEGDFGASAAYALAEKLKTACRKQGAKDGEEIRKILAGLLEEILLKAGPAKTSLEKDKLAIFLLLGVNGVGKTTTAAKLADR